MALRRSFSFTRRKKEDKPEQKPPQTTIVKEDKGLEFAIKMIDKEHELEKNCSNSVVQELIVIYSEAIEYYSHINDKKYLDIQNRMHKMLMQPEVTQALKSENKSIVGEKSAKKKESKQQESPVKCEQIIDYLEEEDLMKLQLKDDKSLKGSPEKQEEEEEEEESSKAPQIVEECVVNSQEFSEKVGNSRARRSKSFDGELDLQKMKEEEEEELGRENEQSNNLAPPRNHARRHNSVIEESELAERQMKKLNGTGSGKNLNIIIDRHAKTNKTTATRAAADVKSQDTALERRLASRQKIKLTQSMSFTSCNSSEGREAFKCDLSAVFEEEDVSTKSSCFTIEEQADDSEKYEKILEAIMEKNFSQRAAKIAEIKVKYETQISEIEGMGESMKFLVEQMRNNMQEEINIAIQEFDSKRKVEIAAIKAVM